jgi:hypothetical protein
LSEALRERIERVRRIERIHIDRDEDFDFDFDEMRFDFDEMRFELGALDDLQLNFEDLELELQELDGVFGIEFQERIEEEMRRVEERLEKRRNEEIGR